MLWTLLQLSISVTPSWWCRKLLSPATTLAPVVQNSLICMQLVLRTMLRVTSGLLCRVLSTVKVCSLQCCYSCADSALKSVWAASWLRFTSWVRWKHLLWAVPGGLLH